MKKQIIRGVLILLSILSMTFSSVAVEKKTNKSISLNSPISFPVTI